MAAGKTRLPSLELYPEHIRAKIEKTPRYKELLHTTDRATVEKLVEEALNCAKTAQGKRRNDRTRPSRIENKVLTFMEDAHSFLQVFTGVMDITKGIDPHTGSMAYGMVSVLVTLGKNMHLHEELAGKALQLAEKWLGRIKRIHDSQPDIENDEGLLEGMSDVYDATLELIASATGHYSRSLPKRILFGIRKPPQFHMQPVLDKFQEAVAEFMVEHQISQASRLKTLVQRQSQDRKNSRMQALREWLGLEANTGDAREQMILEFRHETAPSELRKSPKFKIATRADFSLLRERESYRKWNESRESALFLMSGKNLRYDPTEKFCWLSPLAVEFLDSLPDSTTSAFISTPLLKRELSFQGSRETLVLKVLLYQLLSQKTALYDRLLDTTELYNKVQRIGKSSANGDTADLIFEAIQMLFRQLPSNSWVYIILDGAVLGQDRYSDNSWGLLQHFAQLVCDLDLKATIKCLCIADSRWWTALEDQCTGTAKETARKLGTALNLSPRQHARLFLELNWKQEILK